MKKIVFALLALLMLAVTCMAGAQEAAVTEDAVLASAYDGDITVTLSEA